LVGSKQKPQLTNKELESEESDRANDTKLPAVLSLCFKSRSWVKQNPWR